MTQHVIDRAPCKRMAGLLDGYSLEITTKDMEALRSAAPRIVPGTRISVTSLPNENFSKRVDAALLVRSLGFEPVPHFSARGIGSYAELEDYLGTVTARARVARCFVIAGDAATPKGPFEDSAALISTGAFERHGVEEIGIGGHPDGHPHMTEAQCWHVLAGKCDEIRRRGMAPAIVTQFAFDADRVLSWLEQLRHNGTEAPVRIGVPGPAGIKTLMRFAARCGVGTSASVLAKYGVSIGRLLGSAGPDEFVDALQRRIAGRHGPVRLHFYPFGGMDKTVGWINRYDIAR